MQALQQVLRGLESHALKGPAEDHERFRADMRRIHDQLSSRPGPSEVLAAGELVARALEEHHCRLSRFMEMLAVERETLRGLLTKALSALEGGPAAAGRLSALEKELQQPAGTQDIRTARAHLAESLKSLHEELARHRECCAQVASEIRTELEKLQPQWAPSPQPCWPERRTDPVTGLPSRSEAEAALEEISRQNRPAHAVLFVVQRLELINMRFGYAAGDQVLLLISQHVAQSLSGKDSLFRWSGPALVALLEGRGSDREVRAEVEWIASQRLESTLTVAGRTALLPAAADWVIFTVAEYRPVQLLFQQLDLFVQGRVAGGVVSA